MNVLKFLEPFAPLLQPVAFQLEQAAVHELKTVIETVGSPDLKQLLQILHSAVDAFAQVEIKKLT